MMTAMTTRTISWFERLNSSVNGNPRYRVHFDNGSSAITMSDAGFCYAVGNPGLRDGDTVEVEFTRAGRIRNMKELRT